MVVDTVQKFRNFTVVDIGLTSAILKYEATVCAIISVQLNSVHMNPT